MGDSQSEGLIPTVNSNEQIIIETQGLTREFKETLAVDSLDLSIRRGELFASLRKRWRLIRWIYRSGEGSSSVSWGPMVQGKRRHCVF
jgi:hypothetical protein